MGLNKLKLIVALILFFAAIVPFSKGQAYIEINSSDSEVLCADSITDSNSAGNYGAGENYSIVICPDPAEGSKVQLMFSKILDVASTDTIYVYDGDDPLTDPLLIKINNDVNNLGVEMSVNSTFSNNSGCLTVVFTSAAGSIGGTGFSAGVNCFRPCQQITPEIVVTTPVSVPNNDLGYIDICYGDTAFFEATGNYPQSDVGSPWHSQSNESSIFTWYFGDSDSISGINLTSVSHLYSFRNGYVVSLKIQDSLGCNSSSIANRKVRVSTIPSFDSLRVLSDTICFGDDVEVVGYAETTEGGFFLGGIFGDSLPLPDEVGLEYTTNIFIENFNPGQTMTSINDIQSLCINMEHSYIGDLEIHVSCPDGSEATLLENPNDGGGTFLGEPVDDDDEADEVGITYEYCFSESANYGTFSDEANNYQYSYTDVLGNDYTDRDYLPEGIYTPDESFSSLVGCPLNGTWTVRIVDNLGSDNGFITGWGVNFDPALAPNPEFYTPDIDIMDFVWEDDIVSVSNDTAIVMPSAGEWENIYNFSVTDSYGCSYDTTFTIYTHIMNTEIYGDTNVCEGNSNYMTTLENEGACAYKLVMYDSFGDGWDDSQVEVFVNGISSGVHSVLFSDSTVNFLVQGDATLELVYTDGTTFDSEVSFQLFDADDVELFSVSSNPDEGIVYTLETEFCYPENVSYAWYPSDEINDTTINAVLITPVVDGTYNVIVTDTLLGCVDTGSVNLYIVPNFAYSVTPQDTSICFGEDITFEVETESGSYTYEWFPENMFISNSSSATPLPVAGEHDVVAAITSDIGCTNYDTLQLNISPNSPPIVDILAYPSVLCDIDPDSAGLTVVLTDTTSRGCNYSLIMFDDFSDGWLSTDGLVRITINGDRFEYSCPAIGAGNPFTEDIAVVNGDDIIVEFIPGGDGNWDQEITYEFYDAEAQILFSDGTVGVSDVPAGGEVWAGIASCPSTNVQPTYIEDWDIDPTLVVSSNGAVNAKPSVNTIYYVTVTDGIGGCTGVGEFEVSITSNTFDPTITSDEYYCDSQAPDTLFVVDPVGYWDMDIAGAIDSLSGVLDPSIAGVGEHWVRYIIDGGCGAIDSVLIEVISATSVNFSDPGAYCINDGMDTIEVSPSGGTWTGSGIVNLGSVQVFDPGSAGAGTTVLTYSVAECAIQDELTVLVNSSFDADFIAPLHICDGGQSDTIYFNSTVDPGGVWSGPGVLDSLAGGFDPGQANQGINVIKYEFLDGCMDFDTDSIFIGTWKDATIDSIGTICEGGPVQQFSAADSLGTWSGDGDVIDPSGLFDPSEAVLGNNTIYYTISGGCGDADTVKVIISAGASISMDELGESCEQAEDGSVKVTALGGVEPYEFKWDTGDSSDLVQSLKPGVYSVTISDATGCVVVDTAYVEASTELCETPAIFIGNIFSPNGDGANDFLIPKGSNITYADFVIYNRWGEKVFETSVFGEGWDGTYKGKDATTGVYVYYLRAILRNGQVDERRGNVTLVR